MNIGELILEYRSKHKLSQRQFAKKCGDISNGYISMLENNVNPATNKGITPTIDKLKLIANGMDMNLDDLFRLVDDMPVSLASDTEPTKQPVLSERALKVARAYDQMSGYGKAIIESVVEQEKQFKVARRMAIIETADDSDIYARYHAKQEVKELETENAETRTAVPD